jgi:lysophospholipase L1-like esterase
LKKKRVLATLSVAAIVGSLLSTSAFAAENPRVTQAKPSLVALGDSITFGYNLGNNLQPSPKAFPYFIGKALHLQVSDLGIPGWKTTDLLAALETNPTFQNSVKQANKITLDIGSNDLLQAFASGTVTQEQVAPILNNLSTIISKIRSMSDADIVVYNIYNPFQVTDSYRHIMGDLLLPGINAQLQNAVVSFHDSKITTADAYDAFGQNQAIFVRANDIHPTVFGQDILGEIGTIAFIKEDIHRR